MNTETQKRAHTRGMALLECVTALFVAIVGLMGALQMLQYGVDKVREVEEFAIAGRVLENELETLRAQPFDALGVSDRRAFMSTSPELGSLADADVFSIIRPGPALPARVKEITVVVAWRNEHGRRVERRLTTLVARREAT